MTLLIIYLSIAGLSGFFTLVAWICADMDFENFWDWLIYNLLWIKQPLKYLYKHFTTWK